MNAGSAPISYLKKEIVLSAIIIMMIERDRDILPTVDGEYEVLPCPLDPEIKRH